MMGLSGATRAIEFLPITGVMELVDTAWMSAGLTTDPQGISVILNCMAAGNIGLIPEQTNAIRNACSSTKLDSHSLALLVNSLSRLDEVDTGIFLLHMQQNRMVELVNSLTPHGRDMMLLAVSNFFDIVNYHGGQKISGIVSSWIDCLLKYNLRGLGPRQVQSIAQLHQARNILEYHGIVVGIEIELFQVHAPVVSGFHADVLQCMRSMYPQGGEMIEVNTIEPNTGYEIDIALRKFIS